MASVVDGSPAATPANTTSARAAGASVARMKTASRVRRSQDEAVSWSIGGLLLILAPAKERVKKSGRCCVETLFRLLSRQATVTPYRPPPRVGRAGDLHSNVV